MNYLALATDYDGTLAENSHVEADVVRALRQLRASGRKVILVTGRELPELKQVFPELGVCDLVVAENGALLYWPETDQEEVLAEGPPEAFLSEVQQRGVGPYSVGRVIFATWRPHEVAVLESLQKLGLGHQIIFNKRAVMVLPEGVNKATGLQVALERLEIPAAQVVGVGDAENDHVFLDNCGVAAAVDNALDALKAHCDLVTSGDHGRGVRELIERMLADDLAHLGPRQPRKVLTTRTAEARPAEA